MSLAPIPRPTAPIRWGILGCGDVTEVKSGPGFQKAEGSRLVSVMRRDAAKAADYAKRHGVPKWTADADALIRDPEVDAVYIATPPGSHCDYALRVCAADKPCYVEKPMARNTTECERMVKAFAKAQVPLFVAYYRRRLPRFLKAKALIEEGALGRITGVDYCQTMPGHLVPPSKGLPWRFNAEQAGGGLFLDVGCHTLDLLDFLVGPIGGVEGSAANLASPCEVEDVVALAFRTASGVPGAALWSFATAAREDRIQILGTEGRLTLSAFGNEPVLLEREKGAEKFDLPNPPHVAQPLIQSVVDELRGRGKCPSTGESALRTARVMDRALDAYYGGRADEFWLRPESWPGRRAQGSR